MMDNHDDAERVFGVAHTPEEALAPDWRDVPRSEMFKRVIVAVDGARAEAQEVGDERYVRHVEAQLFPFLEAEKEKARAAEEG